MNTEMDIWIRHLIAACQLTLLRLEAFEHDGSGIDAGVGIFCVSGSPISYSVSTVELD